MNGLKEIIKIIMSKCFICKSESTKIILELGESPVANNLESDISRSQKAKKYPLSLRKCESECSHIQIGNVINQEEIEAKNFLEGKIKSYTHFYLRKLSLIHI